MTIASTSTVVDQTTDAAFRVWVAEIITMLFTTLGVTQTADTGQINTSTVTRAAVVNTAAGYVIGRFNDTAQATSPVFFKLEFGTGSTQPTNPAMWITVGTGSNGSGTITGTQTVRTALGGFSTISSTITAYITRACYNTTAGVLWLNWKQGGTGTTQQSLAGFAIYRSADNTGAVTTDSVHLFACSTSASAATTIGQLQAVSYLNSTAYNNTSPFQGHNWGFYPFDLTVSIFGSNAYVGPCFQYTPVPGITPWMGIAIQTEFPMNSTASITMVGSTPHTYVQCAGFGGLSSITNVNNGGYTVGTTGPGIILLYE